MIKVICRIPTASSPHHSGYYKYNLYPNEVVWNLTTLPRAFKLVHELSSTCFSKFRILMLPNYKRLKNLCTSTSSIPIDVILGGTTLHPWKQGLRSRKNTSHTEFRVQGLRFMGYTIYLPGSKSSTLRLCKALSQAPLRKASSSPSSLSDMTAFPLPSAPTATPSSSCKRRSPTGPGIRLFFLRGGPSEKDTR
jgi:hypothetical protein